MESVEAINRLYQCLKIMDSLYEYTGYFDRTMEMDGEDADEVKDHLEKVVKFLKEERL